MENPAYYAVIPANVRYSKIPSSAKLLYGELTALAQKQGFCFASNAYFAELYGVEPTTVSGWLRSLYESGFIKVQVDKKAGNKRRIYIADPLREIQNTSSEKSEDPSSEKSEDNNTSIINTNNNPPTPKGEGARFDEFWSAWPVHSRKVAKAQCLNHWRNAKLDVSADELISALGAFKASHDWQKERGRFIPAPLVWLRQQRWQAAPALTPVTEDDEHPF